MKEKTIAERFHKLDGFRYAKLERARHCSWLTIPSIFPPEGYTDDTSLNKPFSSVSARGVTAMSSRILHALLPLDDSPFFRFNLKGGQEPSSETQVYLNNLSYQVYKKLTSQNMREVLFQALQHLIIVGDVLIIQEDDYTFRNIRLDHYVVRRDVNGDLLELIYLEFVSKPEDADIEEPATGSISYSRSGYDVEFNRIYKDEKGKWIAEKELDGEIVESGSYDVLPLAVLRWNSIAGEPYSRSHCEDLIGDIETLENYTRSMIEGMAASSTFWMAVDPAGITDIDDVGVAPNGQWIAARREDIEAISPAATMSPQIQAVSAAVEKMRREIGQAFLLDSASIPSGDRVTATAVKKIGQELENILGGAFSAIARDLFIPILNRTVYLMVDDGSIDKRLYQQFFTNEGNLDVEIVTGLQALNRESDLMKLMQLGEMVRNLPPESIATFKWDAFGQALVSTLGFNPDNWIKSEEEVAKAQQAMQQEQMQQQMLQQLASQGGAAVGNIAQAAAQQDIQDQTGGTNIGQVAQQAQELIN